MTDNDKTKEQLIAENEELRRRVAALEGSGTTDRVRAEEALRESEERYRTLAEFSPDIIYILDTSGNLLYANRTAATCIGISSESLVGKTQRDLFPPDQAQNHLERIRRVHETGETSEMEELYHFGPQDVWLNVRTIPIRNEQGQVTSVMGVCRNITARKQAEESLKKAHGELEQRVEERTAELAKANANLDLFRKFVEASGEGFGMADFDGRIAYANPTLCRWVAAERPEEVIGKNVSTYYSEEYMQRRKSEMLPALLQDGYWNAETSLLPRHGEPIMISQSTFLIRDENGNPFRAAVVISNITERKTAEGALRHSEEMYRTLVETSPDAVIMTDLKGHVTLVSQQAVELYGADNVNELLAGNPLDFFAREDHPKFLGNLRKTLDEGITRDVEYTFLKKDGSRFSGEVSAAMIRDASGKPTGFVAIVRDITARRKAHEALLRERRTLRHMLRASDHERQLIAYDIHDGLAQELAGAMMQFQIYAHARQANPKEAAKAFAAGMTMLQQSHSETRRLISGVRPPILDESGVVAAVAHLVYDPAFEQGPKITFHSRVSFNRLAPVVENAIYRIVQEGLSNARNHSRSKKILVSLRQLGDCLRIKIRDWGVGFDRKTVQENRFGLDGIRERSRLLGGLCGIKSMPGEGTSIVVELPVAEREAEPFQP